MNTETLLTDNIAHWALAVQKRNATGRGSSKKIDLYGIKKLRELILELAVQGKLVPQNSEDEPASVLLERIAAERAQLVKDKKIKKQKALPAISDDEIPFELPVNWEWARLGNLSSDIHYGYTASAKHEAEGVRLLRITDIQNDRVDWQTVPACEITQEKSQGYLLENDDILIARTGGTIGKSYLVENISLKAVFASYLIRVKRISAMYASFIKTYLGSQLYWRQLYDNASGTGQPNINATALKNLLISIPPLAEQHRIVAKVNELMSLCDQLEQQTETSLTAHTTLVENLLATLTTSANADELEQNWNRIAEHFTTLFPADTRGEASIDLLKQTVLQLAVMGKLVPQNPNDEPASTLLEKIAAEKTQLIKEKKIKKQKALPPISEDEKPFELPAGWEWSRLPEVGELARGKSKHRPRNDPALYSGGTTPLVQTGDVARANGIIQTYTTLYNETGVKHSRLWPAGTMCITIAANIADTGILGFEACFPDSVVGFTPFVEDMSVKYFDYFIQTAKNHLEEFAPSTAQKNINLEILGQLLVPLPPVRELNGIVAKASQLLTLCDQIKTHLQQAQQTRLHLADAMVEEALS